MALQLRSPFALVLLVLLSGAACQQSSEPSGTGGSGGKGGAGRTGGSGGSSHTGGSGGDSGSGGSSDTGGSGGSAGDVDAGTGGSSGSGGSDTDAALDSGTMDTGPVGDAGPDGYVSTGAGPFGIDSRAKVQTCKAFPSYDMSQMLLSKTGCVDPTNPTKPVASMIPYTVASPLWSDGADKQRFFAIPDGTLIHVKDCSKEPKACDPNDPDHTTDDDGHFQFPIGTVLMKNFLFNNKLHETRLFMKFDNDPTNPAAWVGYSYAWNAAQTEATLVSSDGVNMPVTNKEGKSQSWYYPSQNDCVKCHNSTVGFSLGPETLNLNVSFMYPSGKMANQLDTFEHIGILDGPIKRMDPLPLPSTGVTPTADDPATLDARARSYLHANCSICHRPEGNFSGLDFRFTTSLKDTGACNALPAKEAGSIMPAAKARNLAPGHPELSVMYERMTSLMPDRRMPQYATSVVDQTGTKIIFDWITSIKACP